MVELDSDDETTPVPAVPDTQAAAPTAADGIEHAPSQPEALATTSAHEASSVAEHGAEDTSTVPLAQQIAQQNLPVNPDDAISGSTLAVDDANKTGDMEETANRIINEDVVMHSDARSVVNGHSASEQAADGEAKTAGSSAVVVSAQSHVETLVEITESTTAAAQLHVEPRRSISPLKAHPSILASPRSDARSPKKVRLDLEPSIDSVMHHPRQRYSDPPGPNSNAVGRDIREITRPRHTAPVTQPISPTRTPERSTHVPQASSPSTTPLRRSLMQDNIMSSERKRRRSMDKHSRQSATPLSAHKPDVVLASTVTPPARVQVEPVPPPPPVIGPYLTDSERTEQILAGQRLIQQKKDEYKQNIRKFCDKYDLTPGELMAVVNEMPKRRSMVGAVYWADVDNGLRERFGR